MSAGEADFGLEISKGVLAKFVMAIVGFAGSVVFARVLGPAGYGTFYIALTLVNVLDNPVTGWGVACKKRISETRFPTAEALGSGITGAIALPFVIVPGVYLFQQYTDIYDLSGLFVPFSVLFATTCFFAVTNRILSARSNFAAAEWSDTLRSFLTTPIQLGFVLLGFGAAGMVYGLAIATLLTVPYVLYRIGIRPALPSRSSFLSITSYAKYSIPNGFLGTAQSHIDILLLGAILASSAVGEYQVAMQLTMPGTFIGGVVSAGLMARVSEHSSRDNTDSAVTDVTNSLGYASFLAIPLFFGAASMPNDLTVTVFGAKYAGVGLVLVGLALFRIINMQTIQLGSTIAGLDRPDIVTRVGAVTLVLNVGLGYLLLLEYGVIGVVAATVVSELLKYVLFAYTIKQILPSTSLFPPPFYHQLLAGSIMFVIVDRLHAITGVSWWGELSLLIVAGVSVYLGVLTAVSEHFRTTFGGVISDALAEPPRFH